MSSHQNIDAMDRAAGPTPSTSEVLILQIAVALVFFCHGVMALKNSVVYHSEWSNWIQGLVPSHPLLAARILLSTAGVLDILAAVLLLQKSPPRAVFLWLLPWSFATALSRLYFLSHINAGLLHGALTPIAEFSMRFGNFLMPLLLWAKIAPTHAASLIINRQQPIILSLIVTAACLALALKYLVAWHGPEYPYKMQMLGLPLAIFHGHGALAMLSFLGLALALARRWRAPTLLVSAALLVIGFNEASDLLLRQAVRGPVMVLITLGEHAGLLLGAWLWLRSWQKQQALANPSHIPYRSNHGDGPFPQKRSYVSS